MEFYFFIQSGSDINPPLRRHRYLDTSSEQKQTAINLDLHSVIIVNAWSFTVYMYTQYIYSAI